MMIYNKKNSVPRSFHLRTALPILTAFLLLSACSEPGKPDPKIKDRDADSESSSTVRSESDAFPAYRMKRIKLFRDSEFKNVTVLFPVATPAQDADSSADASLDSPLENFDMEIYDEDGVFTALSAALDEESASELLKLRAGQRNAGEKALLQKRISLLPELEQKYPQIFYYFFYEITYGKSLETLAGVFGELSSGRCSYDTVRNAPVNEYHWKLAENLYLSLLCMDGNVVGKSLTKTPFSPAR